VFGRIRESLTRTKQQLVARFEDIVRTADAPERRSRTVDPDTVEALEELLISADIGVTATDRILSAVKSRPLNGLSLRDLVKQEVMAVFAAVDSERPSTGTPTVVLIVGVNGTGKTTTVGKLANLLKRSGAQPLICAADTFRAAAVDQLATWGERVGVEVVRGPEGGDPASVAFEAVKHGVDNGVDTVLVDTAGRLQNKAGLMDELGKIKRVIEKQADVTEVLLVLDATTGQNGLIQARVFSEIVDVTGIVLTKLDGSAKGGIVVQVQRELGVPVKLVGLGEGADDMAPFDAAAFVDALLG